MAEARQERRVAAPPAAVWKILADFDRIDEWAPNVDHASAMTHQTEGPGTTRRILADGQVVLERVVTWEPERTLSYEFVGLPPVISAMTNTWAIEPDGDGSTVSLTVDVQPGPRPPMRIIARALARRISSVNTVMLGGLADALEGDAS
ncbi:MAG: SRPBCC family protein [Actinomycetota bacterium]